MSQRLEPIGEGPGLVIDRAPLERPGSTRDSELEATAHSARVLASARRMAEVHRDTFRTLAG
jgi:hypothetical protein